MFRHVEIHIVRINLSAVTAARILHGSRVTIRLSGGLVLMGPVFVTPVAKIIGVGLDLRRSAFGL